MNEKADQMTIADGLVVSLDYSLRLDNGDQVDESADGEPMEFLQGQGHIIPGLERALYGMAVGDEQAVVVEAVDGYGEQNSEAFEEVPKDAFPAELAKSLEPGMPLQAQDESGEVRVVYVSEILPESVLLDFNHPLAGERLHFQVKIAGLREATTEELEHGHAHGAGHHH